MKVQTNNQQTILVTGATGGQGGSVTRALLKENKFRVRILTRNAESQRAKVLKRAGAEVVVGDMDDVESLKRAMKDVYGVFGVTNFWEHFAKEVQHGINLMDAAKESGIQHLVMHTLPDYYRLSKGRYSVPHYDIKASFEEYSRGLGLPATFVHVGFYYENFLSFFPLQKGEDGNFYFGFPQGNTKLAATSVEDVGGVVASVFNNPAEYIGQTVGVAGDDLTGDEYALIMSNVLKKHVYYNHIPRDVYASYGFPGAEELANMFEVQRLFIPERNEWLKQSYQLNLGMQRFENWVAKNKYKFINLFNSQFQAMVI